MGRCAGERTLCRYAPHAHHTTRQNAERFRLLREYAEIAECEDSAAFPLFYTVQRTSVTSTVLCSLAPRYSSRRPPARVISPGRRALASSRRRSSRRPGGGARARGHAPAEGVRTQRYVAVAHNGKCTRGVPGPALTAQGRGALGGSAPAARRRWRRRAAPCTCEAREPRREGSMRREDAGCGGGGGVGGRVVGGWVGGGGGAHES